jgi:hypothetical protein
MLTSMNVTRLVILMPHITYGVAFISCCYGQSNASLTAL